MGLEEPGDNEFEDTALLASAVDLADFVLLSDGDSEEVAAWIIDGLFDVDRVGSVRVLEGVGAFVAPSSCRRATAVAAASAEHAQSAT
jgi:hypothetical protein